jgi:amino acid transporter
MAATLGDVGNMVDRGGRGERRREAETVGLRSRWTGAAVSLVLAWVILTVGCVYNYSFGRLLFVSGMEKRLPHQIGRVNRNKVPANAITLQSVISTILTIFIFFIFGSGGSDAQKPFFILYAGVTIVWCISTALLFLDIFFAKRVEPERFERERGSRSAGCHLRRVSSSTWRCSSSSWAVVPHGFLTLAEWNWWMFGITAVSVLFVGDYVISQSTRKGRPRRADRAERPNGDREDTLRA